MTVADLSRTCGDLRFEGPVDEDLVLDPIPDDVKQILDVELERIGVTEELGTDLIQWYLASRTEESISVGFKRPTGDLDSYTEGHLRLTGGVWRGGGWGPCEMRLNAEDRQTIHWQLEIDLDPSDSIITVRAGEDCRSEPPLEAADIEPVIVHTPERVTVLLTAPFLPRADNNERLFCWTPGPFRVDVDLGEPLGDRELHDGGTLQIGSQLYPPGE